MVVYTCKKCRELNYLTPHAFWNITDFGAKCKKCGFKFPSFTQMNEVTFKTAVLTNSAEECPDCSETLAYSKRDYFIE